LDNLLCQGRLKKGRRDEIVAYVRNYTNKIPYLFSGEVSVSIELCLSAAKRYETDKSSDIDNVIKPLLDALSGPDGIMVDDHQVQDIQCYWTETEGGERTEVTIRDIWNDHVKKDKLFFVHVGRHLYYPIEGNHEPDHISSILKMLVSYKSLREELEKVSTKYSWLRQHLPMQRYFHRTRIGKFERMELAEAVAKFHL